MIESENGQPDGESERPVDSLYVGDDLLEIQYDQVASDLRFNNSLFWRIPSVAAAINSGILVVSFRFVESTILRPFLLLIGLALTASLAHALLKIRYWTHIQTGVLNSIEKETGAKHIQRSTKPFIENSDEDPTLENHWYLTSPDERSRPGWVPPYAKLLNMSADKLLIISMWLSATMFLILFLWQVWVISSSKLAALLNQFPL